MRRDPTAPGVLLLEPAMDVLDRLCHATTAVIVSAALGVACSSTGGTGVPFGPDLARSASACKPAEGAVQEGSVGDHRWEVRVTGTPSDVTMESVVNGDPSAGWFSDANSWLQVTDHEVRLDWT